MVLYYSQLYTSPLEIIFLVISNSLAINVLFSIVVLILILFLIYKIFKIRNGLKSNLLEKSAKAITKKKEYQIYLFFLGIILPIIEITFEFLKLIQMKENSIRKHFDLILVARVNNKVM